jgi:hypothetical protein
VIVKFADDAYLVIPAPNTDTCEDELAHIQTWASHNNLQLNRAKTQEIVFKARTHLGATTLLPPPFPGIKRVRSLTALGVFINDKLTVTDHVSQVLASCSGQLYALRVLRDHGMPTTSLQDVFRATVLAKMLYCSPARSGFCSAADRGRFDAFLRRSKRYGFYAADTPAIADLFDTADETLFNRLLSNNGHVLQPLLPQRTNGEHNLRRRRHDRQLVTKSAVFSDNNFVVRMLYKNTY